MVVALSGVSAPQQASNDELARSIRAVLAQNCVACHNPANPKNRINFLKAANRGDLQANRGLWRDVAMQLRNRTMPPVESKLTDKDRLRAATWIDGRLRQTACDAGNYAGAVALRRLNRREYHNTIRVLLGVEYNVSELFPADGTGGAEFDTNGAVFGSQRKHRSAIFTSACCAVSGSRKNRSETVQVCFKDLPDRPMKPSLCRKTDAENRGRLSCA
jgi:hypothetical protein